MTKQTTIVVIGALRVKFLSVSCKIGNMSCYVMDHVVYTTISEDRDQDAQMRSLVYSLHLFLVAPSKYFL